VSWKESDVNKQTGRPCSPSNRLVTDISEGGSTISSHKELQLHLPVTEVQRETKQIPASIVTKPKEIQNKCAANFFRPKLDAPGGKTLRDDVTTAHPKIEEVSSTLSHLADRSSKTKNENWNSEAESDSQPESETESDTDDEETELWAARLLGKIPLDVSSFLPLQNTTSNSHRAEQPKKVQKKFNKVLLKKKASAARSIEREQFDTEKAKQEMEEERRKREEAKPLTAEEMKAILGDDDFSDGNQHNWVRRSVRQPSRALLNTKPVRRLMDMLRMSHPEMVVLKMKKFINDPNAPCVIMDAALNAMEENTNCQALYIQVSTVRASDRPLFCLL
jgi:hypothetical protein